MLKPLKHQHTAAFKHPQPPSRGCVLKPMNRILVLQGDSSAAFARLCVETSLSSSRALISASAAFARLCVETSPRLSPSNIKVSAAFARLCVETLKQSALLCVGRSAAFARLCVETSPLVFLLVARLSAAFARLCVETFEVKRMSQQHNQPPSRGCVLKRSIKNLPQSLVSQPPSRGCVLKQAHCY